MDIKEKNEFNDKMLGVLKEKIFPTLVKMARKTLFRTVAIRVCSNRETIFFHKRQFWDDSTIICTSIGLCL